MLIYLKGCYTILRKIHYSKEINKFQFKVPLDDKTKVKVILIPGDKSIESFHKIEVSKEMWGILQSDIHDGHQLPEELQNELSEMSSGIRQATRRILTLIKYCLYQTGLDENLFSVKGTYWSKDKSNWKQIPRILTVTIEPQNVVYLNEKIAKIIQEYLKKDLEPYFTFALRYLHKAKKERQPQYKWINATIAAELAIKEFLSIKKPDITPILLEMPSPPFSKLYGSILEVYTNEKSPKKKELINGQEIRNKLVHKPQDINISYEKAIKYIRDVEIAIYHLLSLLYPKDLIIKKIYKV